MRSYDLSDRFVEEFGHDEVESEEDRQCLEGCEKKALKNGCEFHQDNRLVAQGKNDHHACNGEEDQQEAILELPGVF